VSDEKERMQKEPPLPLSIY